VIWIPVWVLLSPGFLPSGAGPAFASLLAAVWYLSLRSAYRATHFALGPGIAVAIGTATGSVLVSALGLWMPGIQLHRLEFIEATGAIFALSLAWEVFAGKALASRQRVLIVGTGESASAFAEEIEDREPPFRFVGVVNAQQEQDRGGLTSHSLADLSDVVAAQQPDLVVLADGDRLSAVDGLLRLQGVSFRVVGLAHFFEHAFGRVPVRFVDAPWLMGVLHLRQRAYTRLAKRSFDLIGASLALVLSAPLLPIIALFVRLTPGPVMFRQTRLGEGGRLFEIYKFRTMRTDAEEPGQPVWAGERDPRVTPVGRVLRRTHLDELPQLWNVLKGDMSLVGPRPERPEFVRLLEESIPFWSRRLLIKPGLTGWAQVQCGYAADCRTTAQKLSYDLWYLRHRNVIVDLAICAKTVSRLLLGSGAR
jgi:exopolysaccharide biosynthesis polyprenyl glycosylphosphotransferase